jgi:hypothetical protein
MQLGFQHQPVAMPLMPPLPNIQQPFAPGAQPMRIDHSPFLSAAGVPMDKRPPLPNPSAAAADRQFGGLPPRPPTASGVDPAKLEQLKDGIMPSPRGVMDLATALNMGPSTTLSEVVLGTGGLYSYIWNPNCAIDNAAWTGYQASFPRKGQSPLRIAFVPNVPEGVFAVPPPDCRSSRCTSETLSESTDADEEEMESVIMKILDDADDAAASSSNSFNNATIRSGAPLVPAIPLNL